MLWRTQYRDLVSRVLADANTLAEARVYASRAMPTGEEKLPAILLQTPNETKRSTGRGAPKFSTSFDLVVIARLEALTYQAAELAIDVMVDQVELAVLCDPRTVNPLQQFEEIETQVRIDGSGNRFVAEAALRFRCEFYQAYDPPAGPLTEIDIVVQQPGHPAEIIVHVPLPQPTPLT